MTRAGYDLAVVGAGILGLAHAYEAARRGKRVIVIDRDAQANGASLRNFGLVVVTGQAAGEAWLLARRGRALWAEIAPAAGIPILQRGLLVTARRPEAASVIDAFLATEMAEGCRRLAPGEAASLATPLRAERMICALHSPHEMRVESRHALPALARWLSQAHGVAFRWSTAVHAVAAPHVETARGRIEADTVVICPGDDFVSLFPDRLAGHGLRRCKLQMLRIAPRRPMLLPMAVMSDLGLARYGGYAALPEAAALAARLDAEQPAHRRHGVHLIVVQASDGSLVIGDSHSYAAAPDPFGDEEIDALILDEARSVLALAPFRVLERWIGTYASATEGWRITDAPDDATRIVLVTSGAGATTAFAIAEETIDGLLGRRAA